MSIKLIDAVYESKLTDAYDVAVLLVLAKHADNSGRCYPSIERIARMARCKERAVYKVISRLQSSGHLVVEKGGGRGKSNRYRIVPNPAPETVFEKPCSVNTVSDDKETLHLTTKNPAPSAPESSENRQRESSEEYPSFEAFWRLCPRKKGKGAAERAFAKAVKHAGPEPVFDGMRQHARSVEGKDPKFIPHPSTWLNERRWEDEPDQPKESRSGADTANRVGERFAARYMDRGPSAGAVVPLLPARNFG